MAEIGMLRLLLHAVALFPRVVRLLAKVGLKVLRISNKLLKEVEEKF